MALGSPKIVEQCTGTRSTTMAVARCLLGINGVVGVGMVAMRVLGMMDVMCGTS